MAFSLYLHEEHTLSMDNIAPPDWKAEASIPEGPFLSLDAAKLELKDFAVSHEFSLVIKNSYSTCTTLTCSQGGSKRSHKAGGWAPEEGLRRLRTKKVGCPFELKIRARRTGETTIWIVDVINDQHTGHLQLSRAAVGSLPTARRHLTERVNINVQIEELFKLGVELDVDNRVQELKIKQLNGLTEIEALHQKLKSEGVISVSMRDEANRVNRLFFAPKSSRSLTQLHCQVLLMDCTYKTNKQQMPLLHMVGVTGTYNTFTVGCCFLSDELEASYSWALSALARSLPQAPQAVVVDNETALINALDTIGRCRMSTFPKGMDDAAYKALIAGWNRAVYQSASRERFMEEWIKLKIDLVEKHGDHKYSWLNPTPDEHTVNCLVKAFEYIDANKTLLLHRFASFAINNSMHFAHTTTFRAEGSHWSNIKLHLRRSRGTLLDVYERINKSTTRHFNLIQGALNKECVEVLSRPSTMFGPVLRGVTHYALQKVHSEYQKALHGETRSPCTEYFKRVLDLPCLHIIQT